MQWVKMRHGGLLGPGPVCPCKQTLGGCAGMPAKCQSRRVALQQTAALFDQLGFSEQRRRHGEAESFDRHGAQAPVRCCRLTTAREIFRQVDPFFQFDRVTHPMATMHHHLSVDRRFVPIHRDYRPSDVLFGNACLLFYNLSTTFDVLTAFGRSQRPF